MSVSHTHALMVKGGVVYSYGENSYGQLGDGTTTDSMSSWVNAGFSGVSAVGAVGDGVYGMSFAVKGGELYSVGNNNHKNLGRTSSDTCESGRDCSTSWIKTDLSATNIETVLTGGQKVIVQGSDSKIYVTDDNYGWIEDPTTGITNLTSGSFHAYGIKNGTVYAYGQNGAGQFDTGSTSGDLSVFTPTSLTNIKDVAIFISGISDGSSTAGGFALSNSGEVFAIGNNHNESLGIVDTGSETNWVSNGLTGIDSLMNSGYEVYFKKPDGHYYYLDPPDMDDDIGVINNMEKISFLLDSDGDGISDHTEIVAGTDPEDPSTVIAKLLHPLTDQTVNITEDTVYFDSGDFGLNYGENEESELTIIPPAGYAIEISFAEINLGWSEMSLYEGGTNREMEYCEKNYCAGKSYQSYASDGSISVYFDSYGESNVGWSSMLKLVDQSTLNMTDTDGDGTVDVIDEDDDNDGINDDVELSEGTDPLDSSDFFASRSLLVSMISSGKDITNVNTSKITDFSGLFSGFVTVQDISKWDVSSGVDFNNMFRGNGLFNGDVSGWNVSNGVNFSGMFKWANNFDSDLKDWHVSNGTNFREMFSGASSFNADLKDWNVSNGVDFNSMFASTTLFDKDLSKWNVSKGTNFSYMFNYSKMSTSIRKWNAPNVEFYDWMIAGSGLTTSDIPFSLGGDDEDTDGDGFGDAVELHEGSDPNNSGSVPNIVFHPETHMVSEVINVTNDFTYYDNGGPLRDHISTNFNNLTFIPPSGYAISAKINDISFYSGSDELAIIAGSDPTDRASAYEICKIGVCDGKTITSVDASGALSFAMYLSSPYVSDGWNIDITLIDKTTLDTSDTDGDGISNENDLDDDNDGVLDAQELIDGTNPLDNTDFKLLIANNRSELNSLISSGTNLRIIDTSSVQDFSYLFKDSYKTLEGVEHWDVSSGVLFQSMFEDTPNFDRDISVWNVSSAENMSKMFRDTDSFNKDIGGWNVSNVTTFYEMFRDADAFNQKLGADGTNGGWNVSSGENFGYMFYNSDLFNQDINNWSMSNATSLGSMFRYAKKFNKPLNSWDVSNVNVFYGMFRNSYVFNQNLTSWIVKPTATTGYFNTSSSLSSSNIPPELR